MPWPCRPRNVRITDSRTMNILQNHRALTKIARACAYISAAAVILWGIATALLMVLDSLTFNDPRIAEIRSWPLLLAYFVFDDVSDAVENLATMARGDPMWYKKLGSEEE